MGEIIEMREKAVGYLNYAEFKESMDTVVKKVEEGFVQIGYCLKVARDTDILKESGYSSVEEFAKAEYGLDKSRVSRFMEINDRFSEDGYSPYLQPQYQGYGWGKLAVMIMLPDGINKELTQEYSKADITAIKDEIKEEQKISDLEILMEEKDQIQERMENNLQRSIHQLGYTQPADGAWDTRRGMAVPLWGTLSGKRGSCTGATGKEAVKSNQSGACKKEQPGDRKENGKGAGGSRRPGRDKPGETSPGKGKWGWDFLEGIGEKGI